MIQNLNELRVVNARRSGYSIRKITEMHGITYSKVLEILKETQVDAEDKETDEYVEQTMKAIRK